MSDSGWIRINRAITRHWLWSNSEYLQWWLDLLFLAQSENKKVVHDTHIFTLKRGQMIASISFLAHRWERNRKTIIRFLNSLEEEDMIIRTTRDRQTAILTICKYDSYQQIRDTIGDTIGDTIINNVTTCKRDNYQQVSNTTRDTIRDKALDSIDGQDKEKKEKKEKNQKKEEKEEKGTSLKKEMQKEKSSVESNKNDRAKASEEIFRYFNEMMAHKAIPPIARMTEKRKGMISARMREGYNLEAILSMIKRASESDFLNGINSRNWIANFDWLFLPNNFPKVHEGNYDNRTKDNERSNSRGESQAQAADGNNRFTSPEVPKDYSERF